MTTPLQDTVASNVRAVKAAYRAAYMHLEGKWIETDAVESGKSSLRRLEPLMDEWAERGNTAAAAGAAPYSEAKKGWPGWIEAGRIYVAQFADISEGAANATLENIRETAANAPATTAKAIKTVAKATAKAAGDAAEKVVSLQTRILWPLAIIGIAGAGLYAMFMFGGGRR